MPKKKNEFYSLTNIKKKNATYNVIIGERSNGKTYACLLDAVKNFLKDGKQFAYVRRWKEDISNKRASQIFSSIVESGALRKLTTEYDSIIYRNGRFYLVRFNEKNEPIYNENDCLGFTFALSNTEHDKSVSYPKIKTIVFDEFLTNHLYLQDEFILFMNTVSTIVRRRTDVEIYMLGNTVNRYSPYFDEMGLTHIREMKQGTIDVYRYGDSELTVAVEYCKSLEKSKSNNHYFAFGNAKLEMITGGSWSLNIYPHLPIKYKQSDVILTYYIDFNDMLFTCDIVEKDNYLFTYIHEKTTPLKHLESDIIFSFDYIPKMNYNRNILRPFTKLHEKIAWFYKTDRVFYQNNLVGDSIANYLKICRGGQ